MAAVTGDRPKKLQRISQACDLCHRRSIRCRPSEENEQHQCQNCYDFGVECTYLRPSRRRRNPSGVQPSPTNVLPSQRLQSTTSLRSPGVKSEQAQSSRDAISQITSGSPDMLGAYVTFREGTSEDQLGVAWRSYAAASYSSIEKNLKIFMDYVYPIFPLFHGPTLFERLRKQHHLIDRGFFASVMAACALAAARVRDGAIADLTAGQYEDGTDGSSEVFFTAAQAAIFKDLSRLTGFGVLRAAGLLALTCIQYGQIHSMHQFMGYYHTLSAMQQFHDEDNWPEDIPVAEREERRRLFWSMYQLDVYIACVFHGMPHAQEAHSNVNYPAPITDEQIASGKTTPTSELTWLQGWNFTTDLYRVLEYILHRMRTNRNRQDRAPVGRMFVQDQTPISQIIDNVVSSYYHLPEPFKRLDTPVSGTSAYDIFGFQMANIQATLQLVRMKAFEADSVFDVYQKCSVVEQILSTFRQINPQYLRVIGTPLVYHLGCIGRILASVISGVLTEDLYNRVRQNLDPLADLLEGLESSLQPTSGASKELRAQIEKIDRHMQEQERGGASMTSMVNGIPGQTMPSALAQQMPYQQHMPDVLGSQAQSAVFQLPQELTGAWPWPFEFATDPSDHLLPGFTNEEEQ